MKKTLICFALLSVGLTVSACNTAGPYAPDQITSSLGTALEYNKICQTENARQLARCNRAAGHERDADVSAAAYDAMAKAAATSDLRVKTQPGVGQ